MSRWLSAAAAGLGVLAWALIHPYQGIFHDANLYTLQALARLHPLSLSQDVFLKFGSQDRFTLFSPIYAAAIHLLGLDHAAALLTFLSQLALLAGSLLLARVVLPRWALSWALAGVLALPLYYGPDRIFTGLEDFLTPRMLAESLVLAALAAILTGRMLWASCALLAALAMHPVMAAAGAAAIIAQRLGEAAPRTALLLAAIILVAALLGSFAMPMGMGGRFDAGWASLVEHRSPYLFLRDWELDDLARAGIAVTTLLLGSIGLEGRARTLSRMVLATVVAGWLLTAIGCDSLHLILVTQLQPWRWQWLASLTAVLLLPMIAVTFWSRGIPGRSSALLLLSGWIFGVDHYALIACALCVASLWAPRLKRGEARLVGVGAVAVIGLAVAFRVASNLEFTDVHYLNAALPLWLRRACSAARDGSWIIMLLGALAMTRHAAARVASQLFLCAAMVLTVLILPYSWQAWSESQFANRAEVFAPWRELIPPTSDVFWPDSPASAWALLERGNYLSGLQTSGLVYSRPAALEMQRRAKSLGSQIAPPTFLDWADIGLSLSLSPAQIKGVCDLGVVDFLITTANLGFPPLAQLTGDPSSRSRLLKLYRCPTQARAAAAAT